MSPRTLSLEGKVAIVTGGGTGIGRAISLEFAKAGADVVVASRKLANLEKAAGEIKALGRRSLAIQTDVTKKTDVDNLVQRTIDEFGVIDILVNNAGINPEFYGPLVEHPEDAWDRNYDANFKSCFHCCRAVSKRMIERKKGNIINIASVAGFTEYQRRTGPYRVAKASMINLSKGLSWELGPYNIRVNCIAPAYVDTEGMGPVSDGIPLEEAAVAVLLGRIADPVDIAGVALFLASELSRHITGQTIVVDGGGNR